MPGIFFFTDAKGAWHWGEPDDAQSWTKAFPTFGALLSAWADR